MLRAVSASSGTLPDPLTSPLTITPASANVTSLTLNQSLTGANAQSALSITPTWNTSGNPSAVFVNVTNTASGASASLIDLQVGSVSQFNVSKVGTVSCAAINATGSVVLLNNGTNLIFGTSLDVRLARDAANILALRNATTAQTFRVYGTFTDASNGDWLNITKAAGGTATISTQANGTGVAGDLIMGTPTGTITISAAAGAAVTVTGNIISNGSIRAATAVIAGNASSVGSLSRGYVTFPSDGVFTLSNNAGTDFGRLQFGGTTSAFPALKRNGVGFDVVRADDTAGSFIRVTGVAVASLPAAATAGAGARAYVTDATATLTAGIGAVVTGGGANQSPVWSDGTNWRQG